MTYMIKERKRVYRKKRRVTFSVVDERGIVRCNESTHARAVAHMKLLQAADNSATQAKWP